ncbi:hypothetical protein [Glycomyces artemisiae]|uniref:Uncharacterized protein n=1 Tax=Glycomyces artemisiae TaxID=1076443 RepID=A0A2T0UHP2_9ACTN|nr:hypothetical protein [Glycomyces artemisiae]PRY57460.1 hypothetical protein B0I28_107309 [Glycomyces artemisiae]
MNIDTSGLLAKWTRRVLYFGLIAGVPVVAVAALLNQLFFSLALAVPLLLAANAFALASVDQMRRRFDDVDRLRDEIRHFGSNNARIYRNDTDFYADVRGSVARARESVWVSYIRQFRENAPRAEFERHLEACFEWARSDSRHVFRRIMSNGTAAEPMTTGRLFGEQQLQYVAAAEAGGFNYLAKVLTWMPMHNTDSYSMILIDDEEFYFVLSGAEDEFWALHVNSRNLAAGPLRDRFNHLWHDAHSLRAHYEGRCECDV